MYLCAGLGDGTEVVDQICLGHAQTCVGNGESLVGHVGSDGDLQVGVGVQDRMVRQGQVSYLVQGVRGVGYELAKEDVLVRVCT